MTPMSARSRSPINVVVSIESSSFRASSADSTGVLPRLTTYFGPRTELDQKGGTRKLRSLPFSDPLLLSKVRPKGVGEAGDQPCPPGSGRCRAAGGGNRPAPYVSSYSALRRFSTIRARAASVAGPELSSWKRATGAQGGARGKGRNEQT